LISDLHKALSEVKVLSGMLPICASCKRIRNDEGYWQQIASYIARIPKPNSATAYARRARGFFIRALHVAPIPKDDAEPKGFSALFRRGFLNGGKAFA
jgi:hypothetical protein